MSLKTNFFILIALLMATFVSGGSWLKTSRIIGGSVISIKEAPYQALVLAVIGNQARGICGGSIISNRFILTAAHCTFYAPNADFLGVQVSATFFDRGGTQVRVAENIIHPNYNPRNLDYDAAILKLQITLLFSDSVQPIPLIKSDEIIEDGTMCTVTGFGISYDNSNLNQLRAVDVPLYNRTKCSEVYKAYGGITKRMLCAGFEQGGKDACKGDSGGPFVCTSMAHKGERILYGIISWGYQCAKPHYPGVYTRIQALGDWIRFTAGL